MTTLASMSNTSGARSIPLTNGQRVRLAPHEQQAVLQEVWQTYFPHIRSYGLALNAIEREPAAARYIAETAAAYSLRQGSTTTESCTAPYSDAR